MRLSAKKLTIATLGHLETITGVSFLASPASDAMIHANAIRLTSEF